MELTQECIEIAGFKYPLVYIPTEYYVEAQKKMNTPAPILEKVEENGKGSKYDQGKSQVQLLEPCFVLLIKDLWENNIEWWEKNYSKLSLEELYDQLEIKILEFRQRTGGGDVSVLSEAGIILSMIYSLENSQPVKPGQISPYLIEGIGKVLGFGAQKYAPFNWQKGIPCLKLIGSTYRHLLSIQKGEQIDPESGLHHIYHLGCEVMFLVYFIHYKPDVWVDDRPLYKLL